MTFHSRIVPSWLPAARVRPSGLNATELTVVGPVRGCPIWRGCPIGVARSGSVTFHSQIAPSPLPAARVCPSGLNATEPTLLVGPVSGCPISVARA